MAGDMPHYSNVYYKAAPWLKALAEIESANNPKAIGKKGEISAYQILPSVWKELNPNVPLLKKNIEDIQISGRIAYKLLWKNTKQFSAIKGEKPTSFDMYVMWNRGFDFYLRRGFKIDPVKYKTLTETATRYSNLVEVNKRKYL